MSRTSDGLINYESQPEYGEQEPSAAYLRGRSDRHAGKSLAQNPYQSQLNHVEWKTGWLAEDREQFAGLLLDHALHLPGGAGEIDY